MLNRSIAAVNQWERAGKLPRTPLRKEGGRTERLYTMPMIEVVRDAFIQHGKANAEFFVEVQEGWAALGVTGN